MRNPVTLILVSTVGLYQKWISPAFPRRCRYYPTCSAYAVDALKTHGLFKGFALSVWRILRCNPWSSGGVDHVPEKGKWKAPEWIPPADWPGHDLPDHSDGHVKRHFWQKNDSPRGEII